jgi:hypothetical protein
MLMIEVWVHPFLSQGVAVDQAKSGVLLATALKCREDMQLQEPVVNGMAMSITAPFQLTVNNIKLRLCICKEKCDYF